MATRAQVRFATREEGVTFNEHPKKWNAQFYRHTDGYPEGLGVDIAESILDNVGIEIGVHIDDLITSSEVPLGRPAPYMLNHLMIVHDIAPCCVAKVGDTVMDIREGQNAHVKYQIAVLSGADDRDTLAKEGPHLIVDSVKDLIW